MRHRDSLTRRGFLKTGVVLAGTITPCFRGATAAEAPGPNSRITIGMIGVGRQAVQINLQQFFASPNAQVVAVCDVDSWRCEHARDRVDQFYSKKVGNTYTGCSMHHDFREVLARQDIDAVMISTPDHWHIPIGLAAARAGKHFSVEKPLSTAIAHGRLLCETAKQKGVITRTDSEFRSVPVMWKAVQCVRNGRIGVLQRIHTYVPEDTKPVGNPESMPVPKELDYDFWLGPAPEKPYTEKRVHKPHDIGERPGWLRISDYTNGMISNWGSHMNDIAQWANNTDRSGPVSVEGTGTFSEGLWDTITGFKVHYAYANGVTLDYEMGPEALIELHGTDGWIKAWYPDRIEASNPAILSDVTSGEQDLSTTLSDKEDFLNAIRSGKESLEPVEVGHRTVSLCQIGLIAVQLGRKLAWDPEKERFMNDDEANARLDRPVRGDWLKS